MARNEYGGTLTQAIKDQATAELARQYGGGGGGASKPITLIGVSALLFVFWVFAFCAFCVLGVCAPSRGHRVLRVFFFLQC